MKGILLVNKKQGITSRDVINDLNHIFETKKIGHTGTLDPLATGVLVVCVGRYTKLVNKLSSLEKEYIAQIKVGVKTDTLDITGNIVEERKCNINKDEVITIFNELIGSFKQVIPKYSAKKVNGKKLYEYARNGEDVILPENEVEIKELELMDIHDDIIEFRTLVSKGTYIRSLIEEICNRLGIIGTMASLIRTKQGKFDILDSYTIEEIKNKEYKLLSALDVLDYPEYKLNDAEYFKVKNGNKMQFNCDNDYLICTYHNEEIAIYGKNDDLYIINEMLI